MDKDILLLIITMAVTTYLLRMLPFQLMRKKLTNRYLVAFFDFIPYAVLASMTVPAAFFATGSIFTATAGILVALFLAYKGKSLTTVALCASLAVFLVQLFV